jgi:uncharacterized protein YjbI with pentapeptide repeats
VKSMANQEHLDILKQGVEVWNKWRQEHPEVKPDLSDADLSNIELTGFITRKFTFGYRPNFYSASIIGVDLTGATLARANLSEAHMATTVALSWRDASLKPVWEQS